MSENAKTITFVVVGLLAIVAGLLTRPTSADLDVEALVGTDLTEDFTSPEEAKRLRIVRFDEDTATLREFEVAEDEGLWSIPSKSGYPADAARQMAEAATSLMDRKILQVASRSAGDHEQFGVVDPLSPKLEPGQQGVGTRVTMSDEEGEALADLIIGKAVKDAEGQRYVRQAGRDIVYVIEIDRSKLSTSFEDWIEKDLLKLNSWDLAEVEIKDYSAELVPVMTQDGRFAVQASWDPRAEMTFGYDDSKGDWAAIELKKFDPAKGEYVEFKLSEDEELNEKALNDLKSALDDLQIVDVVRKPQGLSQDLKAGEDFMNNREALRDLMSRGFTPAATTEGAPDEIISSDGEVIATLKDGTEYVLRFGNLTNVDGAEAGEAGEEAAAIGDTPAGNEDDINRYLFVMARFNENAVKQPELQELPELPQEESAATEEAAEGAETAGEVAETPGQASEGSAQTAEPKSEESGSEDDAAEDGGAQTAVEESAATEGETPAENAEAAEPAKSAEAEPDAQPADSAADEDSEPQAEAPSAKAEDSAESDQADTEADAAEGETDTELEKVISERKRIEQENQRKLDEYQETLKKGRENVKELNVRFGDWYFVVDDEVFQKIRLSREDVIKKKEQTQEDAASVPGEAGATTPPTGVPGLPQIPGVTQ